MLLTHAKYNRQAGNCQINFACSCKIVITWLGEIYLRRHHLDDMANIPELLTISQAAERYGLNRRRLFDWIRYGILEARKVGNVVLTTPAAMEAAVANQPKRGRKPGKRAQVNKASEASDSPAVGREAGGDRAPGGEAGGIVAAEQGLAREDNKESCCGEMG